MRYIVHIPKHILSISCVTSAHSSMSKSVCKLQKHSERSPSERRFALVYSPWVGAGHHLEAGSVAEQLVQGADDAGELGPQVSLLHPALQHQLVQHHGTVHGRGQPVVLLHRRHHLRTSQWTLSHLLFTEPRQNIKAGIKMECGVSGLHWMEITGAMSTTMYLFNTEFLQSQI